MKNGFEVIKEGLAKARFGSQFSGGTIPGIAEPLKFAAVENNGGLDPAEYYVTHCRLLSMAVTPYRKFDFTREGVLKAAVPLFEGLTLYANHDADVNDWKGLIQEPVWDADNTPNGINAKAVLDKTIDPKLARGVETKALRSFSVTIWFSYEKSHPDLPGFYDRLGEMVDGEMVRFVVTEITNAGEVSVVWEGEDPFAKSFEAGGGQETPPGQTQHTSNGGEGMKLSQKLAVLLALTVGAEIDEATLEAAVSGKIEALQSEVTGLKPDAAIGVQALKETREKAVTLYKAAKGEKSVEAFITGVIEKADLATARAFVEEYQLAVDESIPLACPKCGEKLSRRSSVPETDGKQLAVGKRADDYKL
ncbi:MAG: hypothetical protein PHY09_16770 [Desulfuromonadaceae bacterium]|nr:hypothetical protein [Desulfuromonadaceae bacterium]MDD5107568.1 hypothetical protein [Desulfuromonadaceae bacterium]